MGLESTLLQQSGFPFPEMQDAGLSPMSITSAPIEIDNPQAGSETKLEARPLKGAGFSHSTEQCLHICGLKQMTTVNGEILTDDTVSLILTYYYATTFAVECKDVHQHLVEHLGDLSNDAVQMIWLRYEAESEMWLVKAQTSYWQWMDCMKAIWMKSANPSSSLLCRKRLTMRQILDQRPKRRTKGFTSMEGP